MDNVLDLLITFFFGVFGVHKFMKGQVAMGLVYLFTGGLFGIGWLVDVIKSFSNLVRQPLPSIGYHTQNTLPDYQLLEWQQIIIPGSRNLVMSRKQLEKATKDLLLQYATVIDDCQNVIYHTLDPKNFFYHYELLLKKLSDTKRLQHYMNLNYNVENYLNEYIANRNNYYIEFINRSWNNAIVIADTIYDEKEKKEIFTQLIKEYKEHNSYMTEEIIAYYEKKYYTKFPNAAEL